MYNLLNHFIGCTPGTKTSCTIDEKIYYCARSNIVIADQSQIQDIIFLNDDLTFISTENSMIVTGDIKGGLHLIDMYDHKVISFNYGNVVQNAHYIGDDLVFGYTLDELFIIDMVKQKVLSRVENKEIGTCSCIGANYIFVGSCIGKIYVYNFKLELVNTYEVHYDRIQDIKITYLKDEVFICTSSKDNNLKVLKLINNEFESLQTLNGHLDWVNGISWTKEGNIVSSSSDCSIIIWEFKENKWESVCKLSGAKHFLNALIIDKTIFGLSITGGFYKFKGELEDFISGHIDQVTSLDWRGDFLLTSSLDKTSRIFYKSREVGRPQTHGYPINSAKFLSDDNLVFISAGEETIMRVYEPTQLFFLCYTIANNLFKEKDTSDNNSYFDELDVYEHSAIPAELSLTNDVYEGFEYNTLDEYVLSTTAFKELMKIYGHYFEILSLTVCKKFIASANKSLSKNFGGIFLWTLDYKLVQYLEEHEYTINNLKFSADEKYLCAVSKDKTSSLYSVAEKLTLLYRNYDHKRVVWDCSFSHDTKFYMTCSRDKRVLIYKIDSNILIHDIKFDYEVTSIETSPNKDILVAGLENGEMVTVLYGEKSFEILYKLKVGSKKVNTIKFDGEGTRVAVGTADGLVSVYGFVYV